MGDKGLSDEAVATACKDGDPITKVRRLFLSEKEEKRRKKGGGISEIRGKESNIPTPEPDVFCHI